MTRECICIVRCSSKVFHISVPAMSVYENIYFWKEFTTDVDKISIAHIKRWLLLLWSRLFIHNGFIWPNYLWEIWCSLYGKFSTFFNMFDSLYYVFGNENYLSARVNGCNVIVSMREKYCREFSFFLFNYVRTFWVNWRKGSRERSLGKWGELGHEGISSCTSRRGDGVDGGGTRRESLVYKTF